MRQSNVRRVPLCASPRVRPYDVTHAHKNNKTPPMRRQEVRHRPYPMTSRSDRKGESRCRKQEEENVYEVIDELPRCARVSEQRCERQRYAKTYDHLATDIPNIYFTTSSSTSASTNPDDLYETPPYCKRRSQSRGSRSRRERDVITPRHIQTKDYGWIDSARPSRSNAVISSSQPTHKKRVCFQTVETNV